MWSPLCVGDIFVVDKDLGNGELWDGGHTSLSLLLHGTAEAACPVEGVEEANNNITADRFLNALEAGPATQELFQPGIVSASMQQSLERKYIPQALVVVDDFVMC